MSLPETEQMPRRPVYDRYLRRRHHMPLGAPSELEKHDAIRVLQQSYLWMDEITEEAFRILDECGR